MGNFSSLVSGFLSNPGYTLMRGVARFKILRNAVIFARERSGKGLYKSYINNLDTLVNDSVFNSLDRHKFVDELEKNGVAFGLKLSAEVVSEINDWSMNCVTYADREPQYGFYLHERERAEAALEKPILLSQYFNTTTQCPAIQRLATDPVLLWIATAYMKSIPTFVGANLWWTFPVDALESDRDKHAHVFHKDVDDFKFFKFFFYLTDVPIGEGAHVCVIGSHLNPPNNRLTDPWLIRRYDDDEIASFYSSDHIKEICGKAGDGFAENTMCIHKGSTPRSEARLLLQLQFAMFDHGAMHDSRPAEELARL